MISGCEYKNCTKKGLVFIQTEIDTDKLGSTIALIRHLDYQPDKSDARSQSDDWLILSTDYKRYKDLEIISEDKWKISYLDKKLKIYYGKEKSTWKIQPAGESTIDMKIYTISQTNLILF